MNLVDKLKREVHIFSCTRQKTPKYLVLSALMYDVLLREVDEINELLGMPPMPRQLTDFCGVDIIVLSKVDKDFVEIVI